MKSDGNDKNNYNYTSFMVCLQKLRVGKDISQNCILNSINFSEGPLAVNPQDLKASVASYSYVQTPITTKS